MKSTARGGDSPACTSVFVPEEGVPFSGGVAIDGPSAALRDANVAEWIEALSWVESLPLEKIVPGHGEICGKEVAVSLRERLAGIRGTMEIRVDAGHTKEEAVADGSFRKFFHADASRGEYWLQQRKDTFRVGLERVFDEITNERKNS